MVDKSSIHRTLEGSPYSVSDAAAAAIAGVLADLDSRLRTLRESLVLNEETLRRYYGATRFQQVSESNAIEGSTLDVGETELAVLKGTTLTGHDPGFVRDAIALDRALARLAELARDHRPTDISQVRELHGLILDGRAEAGQFRSAPVALRGSEHRPPKNWKQVVRAMEDWESWSTRTSSAATVLRASVLHAWFEHIHPFSDGNGRTGRAITNLELIRAGYPPVIVRKNQDRDRYISALQESDAGGNIAPFFELIHDRSEAALRGLENAAREVAGYNPVVEQVRRAQEHRLRVWNTAVELLYRVLVERLAYALEQCTGRLNSRVITQSLTLDDYLQLCGGRPISKSWAFEVAIEAPGLSAVRRLAWIGFRSRTLRTKVGIPDQNAPSLYWSRPNPDQYPPWITASASESPGVAEASLEPGSGDTWHTIDRNDSYRRLSASQLAEQITSGFISLMK